MPDHAVLFLYLCVQINNCWLVQALTNNVSRNGQICVVIG